MEVAQKKPMSLSKREAIYAYLLIAPWIVGFIVFTLGPMIASLVFSFTDYTVGQPTHWVGVQNFTKMFFPI